ncbi:MAG: hypothetical protein RL571_3161 [Pseudomonadota bacterium]|jgi:hypothetical protein
MPTLPSPRQSLKAVADSSPRSAQSRLHWHLLLLMSMASLIAI